ncbi:MAG: UDP-N-acetylglucosamine 1-carboxyvinyltransferase, partial [bacterium]|nr:UDP-N-acetylglucosamine 1-carboxyvinyltransferase [bacterium]
MSRFVIQGGRPIKGHVRVSGNKNATLPMIAAALLTDEEGVLENVPVIRDVASMLEIATHLGCEVERDGPTVRLRARQVTTHEIPWELCEKNRTSFLFVAPLLHRVREAHVHPPGGDLIGRRRLDAHFYGFEKLGCQVDPDDYKISVEQGMRGSILFFDEASVTATEHILMAAVLAEGVSEIRNAASEPHVQDLAALLVKMGAQISGIGTNTLVVTGVERLHGTRHRIEGDHIEAGSYLALAAALGGEMVVEG